MSAKWGYVDPNEYFEFSIGNANFFCINESTRFCSIACVFSNKENVDY